MFARKPEPKSETDSEPGRNAGLPPHAAASHAPAPPSYGIEEAIHLMRSLPADQNMDLVVRVVRVTLGSLDVRFEDIIADATRKQKYIQDTIASLHGQVADLEKQLDARRREIAAQEADFKETTSVKERLYLAEKSASGHRPTLPAAMAPPPRASLPKPGGLDESGEMPEILSEIDLEDFAAPADKRSPR